MSFQTKTPVECGAVCTAKAEATAECDGFNFQPLSRKCYLLDAKKDNGAANAAAATEIGKTYLKPGKEENILMISFTIAFIP